MSKSELILIGGGGHCKSVIDVIEASGEFKIAGIVDIAERKGERVLGYEVIADDSELSGLGREFDHFLITLGQIDNPDRRIMLFDELTKLQVNLPVIVSPRAYVSRHATVGKGTIVMHGAIVNASAEIGSNCIINTNALIEHDAVIGNHCHISTSAVVNGGAIIKERSFLGSNSVTAHNITIEKKAFIGCGLRVNKSLPEGTIQKVNH